MYDHMMLDGLEDAYEAGRSMGTFGEDCAAKYSFTRAEQDAFATASVQRAKAATESGAFAAEITPVTVKGRGGEVVVSIDEGPGKVKLDKIPTSSPPSRRTAPSPPPAAPASTTAPPRW
jgi:acetyl-CoA C-acetyltransferase